MNPAPAPSPLQTLWSQPLPDALHGVALARETGAILTWDQNRWLYLFNHRGERRTQTQLSEPIACACAADDGSTYVAIDSRGRVHWLADDLSSKRQHSLNAKSLAAVLDPYGQYLAISDENASIRVISRHGSEITHLQSPRACSHLAVAASRDYFVGCADYGFVGAFDLSGKWRWRDGLVVRVGGIAMGGNGAPLVLACFSEGIQTYDAAGKKQRRWSLPQSVKSVATVFDGQTIFANGAQNHVFQLDEAGNLQHYYKMNQTISHLACGPLGEYIVFAATDHTLSKAQIGQRPRK